MKYYNRRVFRSATTLLVAVLSVCITGCGGSGSDDFSDLTGFPVELAGRYLGANYLPNVQTGTLDLSVDTNGAATGVYTVNPISAQTTVPSGNYEVSGSVNPATGVFAVTGTIDGFGDFSISGNLPGSGAQTFYQFLINGQSFLGTIQEAALGTPNPPTDDGGGGDTGSLIQGGTLSNFTFSAQGGYNGVNPPVDTQDNISGALGTGVNGEESLTIAVSDINPSTGDTRTFLVGIVAPNGEQLQLNQTYQLAADDNSPGAFVALTEVQGNVTTRGWGITPQTTGQATVTAVTENSVTLNFQFTNVGPNSAISNNDALGSFSAGGNITGNFATTP